MVPRGRELYEVWADVGSPWSAWAKPAVFATVTSWANPGGDPARVPVEWALPVDGHSAVIVDLCGPDAVITGITLAHHGYRPVPVFNGCAANGMIVDVSRLAARLSTGAAVLERLALSHTAPPAFLLDSDRDGGSVRPQPGAYDNRWVVVPQDLPSARRLASAGITRVLVVTATIRQDLTHVLLRYQEGGVEVRHAPPEGRLAAPAQLHKPGRFRSLRYRASVLMGLRRNPAGGFGGRVPEPSSGGG